MSNQFIFNEIVMLKILTRNIMIQSIYLLKYWNEGENFLSNNLILALKKIKKNSEIITNIIPVQDSKKLHFKQYDNIMKNKLIEMDIKTIGKIYQVNDLPDIVFHSAYEIEASLLLFQEKLKFLNYDKMTKNSIDKKLISNLKSGVNSYLNFYKKEIALLRSVEGHRFTYLLNLQKEKYQKKYGKALVERFCEV